MKNLANCKPSEFLVQTNKIRKSVAKWIELTDIMNIRKNVPDIDDGMSDEEKRDAISKQIRTNLSDMLDSILDKHPMETLELLALMCFIEPEDADNHPVSEYLKSFTELINDDSVIGFFTSLAGLDLMNTSKTQKG